MVRKTGGLEGWGELVWKAGRLVGCWDVGMVGWWAVEIRWNAGGFVVWRARRLAIWRAGRLVGAGVSW